MARPSLANEKKRALMPVVARAFAELGYRRATTAELAERCGVQETILYRLWPDKKAMFIAAIEYVYELSAATWAGLLAAEPGGSTAERLLAYESTHLGEFGNSRIIFAGLSETDDPEIRRAMSRMYQRYQAFIVEQVGLHRAGGGTGVGAAKGGKRSGAKRTGATPGGKTKGADAGLAAWALVGLGTVASIARELDLLGERERRKLMIEVGTVLLGGREA